MSTPAKPQIQAFFDEPTNTVSYLVWDAATMEGAVIDPVLDYDFRTGKASMASADAILAAAASSASRSRKCWKRTRMPTICRALPISS